MSRLARVPGFGPSDPTDNRELLEWMSRYPPEASKVIWFEAAYLALLLAVIPCLLLSLHCHWPKGIWKLLDTASQDVVARYGLAWIGGMLGGTLFAIKWLYHVVAKGLWNLDRRLWRLFTPHISGGLAFAVIALVSSGIMRVFDAKAARTHSVIVGLAFLVGYFSDSAVAKLSEISDTVFGTSRAKEKHVPELAQSSATQNGEKVPAPRSNSGSGQ
jgi:hypothetical protein